MLGVSVALHVTQLFGALLEPDAALYATVARHMAESNDFVNLVAYQQDWLDKPHLPFWVTALSFKLFGVNEVAYRLPGVAVFFVGVAYTWRLGRLLFDDTVAKLAVLVLLTSQHVVMSSADVRAEPYLVGFITAALFDALRGRESRRDLVVGAFFTALAMMTKGPFVVVPIAAGLLSFEWRRVVTWRLPVFAALTLLFITPELFCLWAQFDAHPEKVMFGRTGVSGVRFFFWDSQFGRFTNTGVAEDRSSRAACVEPTAVGHRGPLPGLAAVGAALHVVVRAVLRGDDEHAAARDAAAHVPDGVAAVGDGDVVEVDPGRAAVVRASRRARGEHKAVLVEHHLGGVHARRDLLPVDAVARAEHRARRAPAHGVYEVAVAEHEAEGRPLVVVAVGALAAAVGQGERAVEAAVALVHRPGVVDGDVVGPREAVVA